MTLVDKARSPLEELRDSVQAAKAAHRPYEPSTDFILGRLAAVSEALDAIAASESEWACARCGCPYTVAAPSDA